uniref:Ig-like domain-containing protein n=1 Tax=Poecilia latipinna TaxID=48699 RepID=A0A3B3TUI1_9TELE
MQTVKPTVILQPNWPQIYIGEKVTLKCEIQGGRFRYGTKQWRKNNSVKPGRSQEYMITSATESDSGDYSCRAEGDRFSLSVWSDDVALVVCKLTLKTINQMEPSESQMEVCTAAEEKEEIQFSTLTPAQRSLFRKLVSLVISLSLKQA